MHPSLLHVVAAYANPMRWASRLTLQQGFERHMQAQGVCLTTVECAYGERPFELADDPAINRVRVRAKSIVWNKENLINIGISRLPPDAKYICWSDADVFPRRKDWASEVVHALQQYDVIQPWSDCYDLGPNDEHIAHHVSFMRQHWHGVPMAVWAGQYGHGKAFPHPGYAWAATRQALDWVGGLIETGALGAGDHHMALALVGKASKSVPAGISEGYLRPILQWQQRASRHINGNIGFIWGTLEHRWHGRKADRRYIDRWSIITGNKFDPASDLKRNSYGVLELAGNKPALTQAIDIYMRSRNEDANVM